jgi:hypothetical protein
MNTLLLQNDGLCHGEDTNLMTFAQMTYQTSETHLDDVGQYAVRTFPCSVSRYFHDLRLAFHQMRIVLVCV